jgi:hypothetical protein
MPRLLVAAEGRTALLYNAGAIFVYTITGFVIDAMGRRTFLFFTYLGSLLILQSHSYEDVCLTDLR